MTKTVTGGVVIFILEWMGNKSRLFFLSKSDKNSEEKLEVKLEML